MVHLPKIDSVLGYFDKLECTEKKMVPFTIRIVQYCHNLFYYSKSYYITKNIGFITIFRQLNDIVVTSMYIFLSVFMYSDIPLITELHF